jgi:hypothetical protein
VGPGTAMGGCCKSRPPPGLDTRNVEPVASRYTNCAIAAHRRPCTKPITLPRLYPISGVVLDQENAGHLRLPLPEPVYATMKPMM